MTDKQLMSLVAEEKMEALGELVKRHQSNALSIAYRTVGAWDIAEDICQEAFIRVYRSAAKYQPTAKFTTWFYRIIVNLCIDEKRKSNRAPQDYSEYIDVLEDKQNINPMDKQIALDRKKAVWQALGQLNKRERITVVLHKFLGKSHREIAEITGWSLSAVESLLVRAYQKLREKLKDINK
ncbi:MAG: RNA polymerase sigma factor [Phycisphaerae bacterium]|nr:RNA polymerase sigma factor [Phycisphaerae bacterium]